MQKLFVKWLLVLFINVLTFFRLRLKASSLLLDTINSQQKDLYFGHSLYNKGARMFNRFVSQCLCTIVTCAITWAPLSAGLVKGPEADSGKPRHRRSLSFPSNLVSPCDLSTKTRPSSKSFTTQSTIAAKQPDSSFPSVFLSLPTPLPALEPIPIENTDTSETSISLDNLRTHLAVKSESLGNSGKKGWIISMAAETAARSRSQELTVLERALIEIHDTRTLRLPDITRRRSSATTPIPCLPDITRHGTPIHTPLTSPRSVTGVEDLYSSLSLSPHIISSSISQSEFPDYIEKFIERLNSFGKITTPEQEAALKKLLQNPIVLQEAENDFNNKKTEKLAANTGDALCQHRALIFDILYRSESCFATLHPLWQIYILTGHILCKRMSSTVNKVGIELEEKGDFRNISYEQLGTNENCIKFGKKSTLDIPSRLQRGVVDSLRLAYAEMTDKYIRDCAERYYKGTINLDKIFRTPFTVDKVTFNNLLPTQLAMVVLLEHVKRAGGIIGLKMHYLKVEKGLMKEPGHHYDGDIIFFKFDAEKESFTPTTLSTFQQDKSIVIIEAYSVHNPFEEAFQEEARTIKDFLNSANNFSDYKSILEKHFLEVLLMWSGVVDTGGEAYSPPLSPDHTRSSTFLHSYNKYLEMAAANKVTFQSCIENKLAITTQPIPFGLFHVSAESFACTQKLQRKMHEYSGAFLPLTAARAFPEDRTPPSSPERSE